VAGLLVSAYLAQLVKLEIETTLQRQLSIDSQEAELKIQMHLRANEQVLLGLAALFETSSSVDREEFRAYTKRIQLDQHFKGVQGLGFSLLLNESQLPGHIASVRKEGFPDYEVAPAWPRDVYSSIVYLEPFDTLNRRAFGFDMYSDPTRRSAMDQARDTNRAALSGKVQLMQETGGALQPGTLMYLPVYRKQARIDSVESRRAALVGWVYSPFRMHDLMQGILQDWMVDGDKRIQIKVYDGDVTVSSNLLYESHPHNDPDRQQSDLGHLSRTTHFNGHTWTLLFDQAVGRSSGMLYLKAWATLGAGMFMSVLVALLTLLYLNTLHRAGRISQNLTRVVREKDEIEVLKNAIFNSANFSSMATDAQGIIQIFNVGAERMLGYAAVDVVNRVNLVDISDYQELISRAMALSVEMGTSISPGFETLVFKAARGMEDIYELTYTRKDGSRLPAMVSITALRDAVGAIIGYLLHGTDNTARKKAEETLAREIKRHAEVEKTKNDWFRLQSAALQVCANAILIVDDKGLVQWENPASSHLSGFSAAETTGHPIRELFLVDASNQGCVEPLREAIRTGTSWSGELINRRKNGDLQNEHLTITPVTNAKGWLTHFIVVKQDITQHKQAEESAKAASLAKSRFLANMSHEIRTPMNGVIGMVDILQKTGMDPTQYQMLKTIEISALNLMQILNDILDFSKIEEGKLDLEPIPTELRTLAESVTQLMLATLSSEANDLLLFVSPELPQWVMLDPHRLRQVLLNLVGNAVKFSGGETNRSSRVILAVEPCILARGALGVKFSVQDNGIGMGPEVLRQLFQPFQQADESTARRFGGTGLGLSICHRLVELMRGEIVVHSTQGEGSEFLFVLPLEEAPAPRMPVFGPRLEGVHVLVVNADAVLQETVSSYCLAAGAEVTLFADLIAVRHALKELQLLAAKVVLVMHEHGDLISENADLPAEVGVVWLTRPGRNTGDGPLRVDAYPLIYAQLIRCVALASGLLNVETLSLSERPSDPLATEAPDIEEAAATQRLILLAEDNEINRTVIHRQLLLLGYACEIAENGAQALQMWRSGRYALLLTDCHMPQMDGFELTAAIRRDELPGSHLPILAITANAMRGEMERCRASGMDDYITKPMRTEDLAPFLDKWLP
jgi:PAS domain S-box-containing protein